MSDASPPSSDAGGVFCVRQDVARPMPRRRGPGPARSRRGRWLCCGAAPIPLHPLDSQRREHRRPDRSAAHQGIAHVGRTQAMLCSPSGLRAGGGAAALRRRSVPRGHGSGPARRCAVRQDRAGVAPRACRVMLYCPDSEADTCLCVSDEMARHLRAGTTPSAHQTAEWQNVQRRAWPYLKIWNTIATLRPSKRATSNVCGSRMGRGCN